MIATIGFFDGLHEGHRYVVSQLLALAKERGDGTIVFTFRNHPASLFAPESVPPMLLTAEEKEERLKTLGIDKVVMLDFNKELASLSTADFFLFMAKEHNVTTLLLGYDNHFGKKERTIEGTVIEHSFEDYVRLGRKAGVEVRKLSCLSKTEGLVKQAKFSEKSIQSIQPKESIQPKKSIQSKQLKESVQSEKLIQSSPQTSSTLIRNLLLEGLLDEANARLGYDYFLEGKVVQGKRIGRKIGFPTANIEPPKEKLVPKRGVYAARAMIIKEPSANTNELIAVVNIGICPTLKGEKPTIEAHILNFDDDIYGKNIRIEFIKRIRDEQRFVSERQLIEQIRLDKEYAIKTIITHLTV